MVKEEQDFSKVENKFKLSLLNVEKRFVDLEAIVSEMADKLKDVDLTGVSEVKQRLDDIEDLIMVEQAGIIELKKMLEGLPKPEAPSVDLSGIEKKLGELEQKSLTPVEKVDLQPIMEQINLLKQEVDEKIKEYASKVPNLDAELLLSKYDTLQKGLNDMFSKKVELDLKVEGVKKSMEIVEHKIGELATERIAEEIQNNKKDVILIGAKMETMERIIKSMHSDLQQAQMNLGKLDSFEKLTLLGKEIESKIERFKLIEDELRRLSTRMEMLYTNMDKRIEGATQAEKRIPEMLNSLSNFQRELDKQRMEILDRVKKDEIKDLSKVIDQNASRALSEIEKKHRELMQKAPELQNYYNLIDSLRKEIKNKLDVVQMKDFVKKGDLQFIYKVMKELDGKYIALDGKVKQVKTDEILRLMEFLKKDVDERLSTVQQKEDSLVDEVVRHTEVGLDEMDYRIQSLLDKIIYLETRMMAIEKMLTDVRMPVILE